MEKRTLIALLLTAVLWIVYIKFFTPKQDPKPNKQQVTKEKSIETRKQRKTPTRKSLSSGFVAPRGVARETELKLRSEKYTAVLTSKGAAIKSLIYNERKIELTVQKQKTYKAKGIFDFPIHFDKDEFLNGSDLDKINWYHRKTKDGVTFFTNVTIANMPVTIEKSYAFNSKDYMFEVSYRLVNRGRQDIIFKKLLFSATDLVGPDLDYSNNYNFPGTSIYSLNGEYDDETKGSGDTVKEINGTANWAGIRGRYFLVIMIPQGFTGSSVVMDNRNQANTGFRTGIMLSKSELRAGSSITKSFKVYLGEKDRNLLKKVDPSTVGAADVWMVTWPIRQFVIWSLTNLNNFLGNMGWALVIFSLITKFIFMPLTNKSTESMKRMSALTPQLNEIKAKYKDKPDMIQKETMRLYKENKVNPLGGCLPLLLQMPFFFALYSALLSSLDLWNAEFIWWMKDLSMPDTVAVIKNFPILGTFKLNILPLFMTVTTVLQQKLTTVDTGGQQQKIMMTMMPIVFLFIFWSMPSGLVLYWALQNTFQVLHQVYVNKYGKKKTS